MPPIYEYQCKKGHKFERFLKIKDYKTPQSCGCGEKAKKLISIPMLNCDMQPWDYYESPVSGRPITSYKERKKDMDEHGCVDYDPGVRTGTTTHMKTEDAKLEKKMDAFVEKAIEEMPVRKKEKLESELNSGADIAYERI